jgi:hypothetical protein
MSAETKCGKRFGKEKFEQMLETAKSQPEEGYKQIADELKRLEAEVPQSDFDRGFIQGFQDAYRNWRKKPGNTDMFDRATDSNVEAVQDRIEQRVQAIRQTGTAFLHMTADQIAAEIANIQEDDRIVLKFKPTTDPLVCNHLIMMANTDRIELDSRNKIIALAVAESRAWEHGSNLVFDLTATDIFDHDLFQGCLARDIDWIERVPGYNAICA